MHHPPAAAGSSACAPVRSTRPSPPPRAARDTTEWKARYAARAGIEGTIAQATGVTGIRHARYTGLPKTTLEHALAATAINLIRLDAWRTDQPLDRRRITHLQRLGLTAPPNPNKPTGSRSVGKDGSTLRGHRLTA